MIRQAAPINRKTMNQQQIEGAGSYPVLWCDNQINHSKEFYPSNLTVR